MWITEANGYASPILLPYQHPMVEANGRYSFRWANRFSSKISQATQNSISANGHNESALNFYLKSLVISTDYFNLPVRSDDHVFRRMIKSCNALGNNTQAAALCQFLEEPDYVVAFHILAEQKQCNDAVDAYYHCFFDVNILEYLIYLHNKKGELQRRRRAVQVIGLLELNSNNNEEIQRETINLRKSTFLRALTKQYVHWFYFVCLLYICLKS